LTTFVFETTLVVMNTAAVTLRAPLIAYARQVLAFGLLCWPAAAYLALVWAGF
jgi:hypothetical protein